MIPVNPDIPMSKWRVLSVFFIVISVLVACSPLKLINLASSRDGYRLLANIPYGNETRQSMDIYLPSNDTSPDAVIVFFYGGSWQDGDKADYRFVAQTLTQRGFVVVIPDYRIYPSAVFPDFVHDGALTVAWVHGNLKQYTGRQLSLFVGGHSAGAHIAAMINYDEQYLTTAGGAKDWISGFIGLAGPYDFLPITSPNLLKVFGAPESHPSSQPINFVDGGEPPALLIHGNDDKTVWPRNSQHLAAAISYKGGSVETLYLDRKNHKSLVLAFLGILSSRSPVVDQIARFIRKHSDKHSDSNLQQSKVDPARIVKFQHDGSHSRL